MQCPSPSRLGAFLAASLWLWAPQVRAEEPPASEQAVLLMLPDLPDDRDERAEAMIQAHTQDTPVELLVRRYDPASFEHGQLFVRSDELLGRTDAQGILWVDLGDDLTLYVLVRGDPQLHGRRIDARDLDEAVALESLANVSASAAVAITYGEPVGLAPERVVAPEDETSAEPTDDEEEREPEPEPPLVGHVSVEGSVIPVSIPHLRARVGYRGQTYAAGLPWLSAVELSLAWLPVPRAHLGLHYEATTSASASAASIGLELQLLRVPLAVTGGYRFDLPRGWGLELGGRLLVEPTRRRTVVTGDLVTERPMSWRVMAGAGLDLRMTAAVREDLRIWLGLGMTGMFLRSDYVFADIDLPLLSPSAVRVTAGLGVEFDLVHR